MISYPNAKINIGLNILSRRPDGFHEIESVFYPVNWKDILEIVPSGDGNGRVEFGSSGIVIPCDGEENLCERAYRILHDDFDIPSVKMHLHKVIPIGAGLGGGSADATFALKMLNELFKLGLETIQLERYAERLGSDCPFFVDNRPKLVRGRGEVMEPVHVDVSSYKLVLMNPGIHIGTAEAYSNVKPGKPAFDLFELVARPVSTWRDKVRNDFEDSLFCNHPEIADLKQWLYDQGAVYASMTGSGSTVYGIFENEVPRLNVSGEMLVKIC